MKRFLSALLAVVMVLALAVPAMAEIQNHKVTPSETPSIFITTDKEEVEQGGTFTMTVNLSGDYQASALTIRVPYDSEKLEFVEGSIEKGDVLLAVQRAGGTALAEQGGVQGSVVSSSCMVFYPEGSSFNTTGTVFSCSFKVLENVAVDTVIEFNPDIDEFTMLEVGESIATPIEHTTAGASITVAAPPEGVFINAVPSKTDLVPGETFTVELSISGDYAAGELDVKLPFDNTLFSVGTITNGEVLEEADDLGHTIKITTPNNNTVRIRAYGGDEAFSATGVIATVEFTVIAEEAATYNFLPTVSTFADMDENDIENTVAGATVNITVSVEPEDVVFHAVPSKETVAPGETFTVDLTITGTYEGHSITWQLNYDPELFECVSFEEGAVIEAARNNGGTAMSQINDSNVRTVIIMPTDALTATGTILTATFTVKEGAAGSYEFLPEITTFTTYPVGGEETPIEYTVEGSTVTIVESEPVVFTATASKEEVEVGETFTVEFAISGDYNSNSITWSLLYDPELFECVSFEEGAVIEAARNNGGTAMSQINDSNVRTVIIMPTDALTATGTILTATFTVKEGAAGSYEFLPEITTFTTYPVGGEETPIEYTVEGSTVTIVESEPVVFTATASKEEVEVGETFTVEFAISGDYNSNSITWSLLYDPELFECVSFEEGAVIEAARNNGGTAMSQINDSNVRTVIIMPTDALTATGTILTATFTVKEGAAGSYEFLPEITTFTTYPVGGEETPIEYTVEGSTVTIAAPATYTITWKVDGQDDAIITVNAGEVPEYPYGTPIKQADAQYTYEFAGWDPEVVAATEDATYTAVWTPILNEYTVTWIIDDQEETETYQYGATPTHEDPVKEGYTFNGWDPEIAEVTGNATYTAQFTVKSYRLTIYYLNEATGFAMPGATAVFADINYGAEYSYTSPEIEGYHLVDPNQAVISGTMPAQSVEIDVYYAINVYTINFLNWDGNGLETYEVEHGTTPVYDGVTPTKDDTQFVHYEFAGWTPTVVAATEDATYTAVFNEVPAPYTVRFYVKNDVLASVNAYYLTDEDMPAEVNWYGYQFTGWDMTLDEINTALENGDVEVHANFEPLANTFTVTIVNGNEVTTKDFTESRWITVKAKAQVNGQYFQYWTMNDVVISYSPRANVRVVDTCTLEAHYGDEPMEVTAVAQLMKATFADNRITFLFYFAAPNDATIVEAGIWACSGEDYENYGLVLDGDHHRFERFCSISDATQPASYTWIKTNVAEGDSWYVRPFITYTLNGEEVTFEGTVTKITAGTDFDIGDSN